MIHTLQSRLERMRTSPNVKNAARAKHMGWKSATADGLLRVAAYLEGFVALPADLPPPVMPLDALSAFNRWWIRKLLHALLRPVFDRAGGNSLRFLKLLDACDCYPFCVEVEVGRALWILDEPSEREDDSL